LRIVCFVFEGKLKYGAIEDDKIYALRGTPFDDFQGAGSTFYFDGNVYQAAEVKLLAPCLPSKIVCVGLNYRAHAEETNMPLPSTPLIFLKPSTAVIGPDDNIVLPAVATRVDYEGELGVVIGRVAKNVPPDRVDDFVLGYTCVNDVTERDIQQMDGQWTRAKGFDTFAPVGPWIETVADPADLKLETFLNGERRQSSRTSDLIFSIAELVSFVSGVMTLLPGDIISSGTPSGIGSIKAGDVVEVRIENIGTLRNPVVSQQ